MSNRQTVTIDAFHDAIVDTCRAHFGDRIRQYGAYEPWDPDTDEAEPVIETPALLLEIEGGDDEDPEDIQPHNKHRLRVNYSCTLHCVLSIKTPRLQRALVQFATSVFALVRAERKPGFGHRGNLWGLGDKDGDRVVRPKDVSMEPSEFVPGLNGRDSWAVRWRQVAYVDDALPF